MPEKLELVEIVRRLAASGHTEPEIIGQLRAAGFRPVEINIAMKKVYRERMEAAPREIRAQAHRPEAPNSQPHKPFTAQPAQPSAPAPELAAIPEALRPMDIPGFKPVPPPVAAPPPAASAPAMPARPIVEIRPSREPEIELEELVEEVVAEYLKKMEERFAQIDRRDEQLNTELAEARKLLEEARSIDKKLEKTLASHTDEFKEFLSKFESRLSALENAFRSLSEYLKK